MMFENFEIYPVDRRFYQEARAVGIFEFGIDLIGEPVESRLNRTGQSQPGLNRSTLTQSTEPDRIWLELGLGSGSNQSGKRLG